MKIREWVPYLCLTIVLAFCLHYYLAEVGEVEFKTSMQLTHRDCGEMGCTIYFSGSFDDKTSTILVEEDELFNNNVVYHKDKLLQVEGKIKYRKLRSHFWINEQTVFTKIDGNPVDIENYNSFLFKWFRKAMNK